jgi:hypothetical protein
MRRRSYCAVDKMTLSTISPAGRRRVEAEVEGDQRPALPLRAVHDLRTLGDGAGQPVELADDQYLGVAAVEDVERCCRPARSSVALLVPESSPTMRSRCQPRRSHSARIAVRCAVTPAPLACCSSVLTRTKPMARTGVAAVPIPQSGH